MRSSSFFWRSASCVCRPGVARGAQTAELSRSRQGCCLAGRQPGRCALLLWQEGCGSPPGRPARARQAHRRARGARSAQHREPSRAAIACFGVADRPAARPAWPHHPPGSAPRGPPQSPPLPAASPPAERHSGAAAGSGRGTGACQWAASARRAPSVMQVPRGQRLDSWSREAKVKAHHWRGLLPAAGAAASAGAQRAAAPSAQHPASSRAASPWTPPPSAPPPPFCRPSGQSPPPGAWPRQRGSAGGRQEATAGCCLAASSDCNGKHGHRARYGVAASVTACCSNSC